MRHIFILLVTASLFLPVSLQAQDIERTKAIYQQHAGNFALIYNGRLESGYTHGYANTPYYPSEYVESTLQYRGMDYSNVFLRLDCHTKRLIIQSPDHRFNISLAPMDVRRAILDGRTFVYFDKETDGAPESTYFVALYEGRKW